MAYYHIQYVGFCLALEQKAYCCYMVTISILRILQLESTRRIVKGDYDPRV